MAFIQTMEFTTDDPDKMRAVAERWANDAITNGTAKRGILTEDRTTPGRYAWIVFFDSAESAAANNERPDTGRYAEEFGALCSDGIAFREFDVVDTQGA